MNFLSVQNTFTKPHNSTSFFFPDASSRHSFITEPQTQLTENNNQLSPTKTVQEVWSKHNFSNLAKTSSDQIMSLNSMKMTWAEQRSVQKTEEEEEEQDLPEKKIEADVQEPAVEDKKEDAGQNDSKEESPSHHARRPPNAFLIFCKKHRPVVRDRFPNLENRGVTKILGEWWALLSNVEKQPYNDLAKEYKDAFLSANPNFRWYKLPAPPLRTLTTRPLAAVKVPAPLASPSTLLTSEFTPGKLADESQLGNLTSLMNNSFSAVPKAPISEAKEERKADDVEDPSTLSPLSTIKVCIPPKPIKKRFVEYYLDRKRCVRNLLGEEEGNGQEGEESPGNLTNQDLMNKVVDGIFAKSDYDSQEANGLREVRKSERVCKGKRYELFMMEGRLLSNKREAKWIHQRQTSRLVSKIESELNSINNNNNNDIKPKPETPKLDLSDTIKRLAERTNVKIDFDSQKDQKRARSISETSDTSVKNPPTNFNLELRISNLPCLGYDEFLQRKRESKKRKVRSKTEDAIRSKIPKEDRTGTPQLVGSKKRKNKRSITHLGKNDEAMSGDLLGLATLAEVAANTEKINEFSG